MPSWTSFVECTFHWKTLENVCVCNDHSTGDCYELLVRGQESGIIQRNFAVPSTTRFKQTIENSSFAVKKQGALEALPIMHSV